ncbi:hypothetical protein [Streptomyces sp. 2A115]|uniref:hypothetical protein n=1 Tax=Streptomyces sp. 2A115 TaxID=3457439 RepID=UPI003FD53664
MTLSAAPPGVALRVTRTAAGRRALQVVLLVGGLLVLGLLCGEQARAADGVALTPTQALTPTPAQAPAPTPTEIVRSVEGSAERLVTSSVGQVAKGSERDSERESEQQAGEWSSEPDSSSAFSSSWSLSGSSSVAKSPEPAGLAGQIPPVTDGVQRVVRPVADGVARPVTERVLRPVTEDVVPPLTEDVVPPIADGVVRPIGGLLEQIAGGLTEPSAPPREWPSLPQLPTLPGLPGVPELPGLPAVPGRTLPVVTAPQPPGGATDEHGSAGREAENTVADKTARDEGAGTYYGPRLAGGQAVAGGDLRHDHTADADDAGAVRVPARQAPDGDPTGVLGHRSAIDNGSSRHGDAQAVALNERAQLRLVPGAAADVSAAGTRDRHRDIPAFPG